MFDFIQGLLCLLSWHLTESWKKLHFFFFSLLFPPQWLISRPTHSSQLRKRAPSSSYKTAERHLGHMRVSWCNGSCKMTLLKSAFECYGCWELWNWNMPRCYAICFTAPCTNPDWCFWFHIVNRKNQNVAALSCSLSNVSTTSHHSETCKHTGAPRPENFLCLFLLFKSHHLFIFNF